jgi:ligand-binding sensor domain-containing protein/signal transduction histidine kinase
MPKFGRARMLAGLLLAAGALTAFAAAPNYIVDPAPPGLPQSSVISMVQTRDGSLWLGTGLGLARYDGNHYEVFNEWNTPGLGASIIVHLFEDSRGTLWVGAGNTVAFIKNGQVATLEIPGGKAELRSTCEDVTGAVWLYLADSRLVRCREEQVENVWPVEPASGSRLRTVIAEKSGQLWIGTETALYQVLSDLRAKSFGLVLKSNNVPGQEFLLARQAGGFWQFAGGKIFKVPTNGLAQAGLFAERYPWEAARIFTAIEDQGDHLVVGTQDGGVFQFDAEDNSNRLSGLSHETALSLVKDREGNLWVGTDGRGVDRVKRNPFSVMPASRGFVVQSAWADTNGGMWLGFNGGNATYARGDTWKDFGPEQGIFNPNFSAVLVDSAGRVWVGTRNGGLFELVGERFQPARDALLLGRNITALFEDHAGNIWVGTDLGLACLWNGQSWRWLNRENGLTANHITAIAEDHDGNLWIGTERNGLNRWREGKIATVHQADGLPSENITSLYVDRDNALWVGTGNGLGRFQAGRWSRFSTQDGLASDSISYLIEDEQEHLWIGSNLGLMRLAKKSLPLVNSRRAAINCRVYTTRDGLPTDECTQGSQPAAHRTPDGRLWFPTIRGLVTVNPADLVPNTNAPLVAIESLKLDDQEQITNRLATLGLKQLVIPAGVERLDISFTSLNLTAPERARFRYWMEGHEATWNLPTDRRSVTYTKLPPDKYHFRLKACNEDGYWNSEGIALEIVVLPPFWKTWWFRTLAGVGLVGIVAGIVYFVSTQKLQRQLALMRQQEALEKERARIARDLHDQLGANLTQVGLLGEMVGEDKDQPVEVAAHAQQICQTARTTSDALDEIVWAANPSNDTLEGLVNYACKYAQDYLALADLRYRLDVPANLPAANIPPDLRHNVFLAFKESVNNVVKHARATEVKIRLRLEANQFLIEIEDNGRGPAEAATKTGRNGLRNMRKRMEDVSGSFEMMPGAERGTVVRLTAPITQR